MHPYGMKITDDSEALAISMVRKAYLSLPSTTCKQRALCCNAGCPNMYYSEFLSMRQGAIEKMPRTERIELTVECMRRYLTRQIGSDGKPVEKPCVHLKENKCSVYDVRHLKCRLYGLIPESMYRENATAVAEEMGVPKEDIPLCSQCPFVKVTPEHENTFPNNKLPKQMILDLEKALRDVDRLVVKIPQKMQDDGYGFLTYHDWHLMYELGEEKLAMLTPLREKLTPAERDEFINALRTSLAAAEGSK